MAWLNTMHATLSAEIPSRDDFATASRAWLEGTLETVFPALSEGLQSRPAVRSVARPKDDIDTPWGQPGHVLGSINVYKKHPAFGGRETLYSAKTWQRALDGLAEYPWAVSLTVWSWARMGSRGTTGSP